LKKFYRPGINEGLLFLILAIGAWLRLCHLPDIPFTHDEFSALVRTRFPSFSELIEKGVMIDGHPAGIQVFLFYWTKIAGTSEAAVKLPFILCGLVSVWLVYRIGSDWFSKTTGLVAAAFLAFMQYPVMYSQIARPYAPGLCFSLLMAFFWTRMVFQPQRRPWPNRIGYILAGALCLYNHHFTLLFAFMVGATGLFFCDRKNRIPYLLANLMIVLLYLPHLPVFIHQLKIGGVEGWLQKPRYDFLADYLQYLFHFSVYLYLLAALLIILAMGWYQEKPPINRKFLLISLIWFLFPYLVGFFYSRHINAVLQYSVLIFSFPYLLFLLFGYFKTEKPLHKIIIVALIAVVSIPSLIFERKHYERFYRHPYREIVVESLRVTDSLGLGKCAVVWGMPEETIDHYLARCHRTGFPYVSVDSLINRGDFLAFTERSGSDYIVYGSLVSSPWENYRTILEKYPYLVEHRSYCGGDFYLFSKKKAFAKATEYFFEARNDFETGCPPWPNLKERKCRDSLPIDGKRSYWNTDTNEYSPTFSMPLRDLIKTGTDVIDVTADIRVPPVFPGAWIVTSVTAREKTIFWRALPINEMVPPGSQGKVFLSLPVSELELRHHALMFNAYIWNPGKYPYVMDNFTIRARHGNPIIYGLYKK